MTTDQLFDWMRRHRVQPSGCSRCGGQSVVYFRDGLERPVCYGCIFTARDRAGAGREPLPVEADCGHPINFVGCESCVDRQLVLHSKYHAGPFAPGCWFCEADREAAA